MNTELMEALTILEKEKNISKDVMMDAIENSLISACKNHFGTSDNIKVIMDRDTCDYAVYAEKECSRRGRRSCVGDQSRRSGKAGFMHYRSAISHRFRYTQKQFGRIATQNAKNLILAENQRRRKKSCI